MATAGQTDEGDRASLQLMQQLLVSTLDPRQQVREQAEQQLVGARDGDFSLFLISLARVLDAQLSADPLQVQEQLLAKQIAAVTFKNCISAKVTGESRSAAAAQT
uniref:HEAT repeat-containing protein n=1 Tax=Toxoplasma gondii TgCATBr9 TaxID=943120 RepID=A0A2T6IN45_TOXGO|nr:HEAT repeat-containing protein [Toxoplasma gondii TgCATBr9]